MTIAIMEFLGLLLYECLVVFLMGAFHEMKPQRKNIYLIFALLPLVLMTMFYGETAGNDTGEYVNFFCDASMKIMPRYWKEVDLKRDMLLSFPSALTFLTMCKVYSLPKASFVCSFGAMAEKNIASHQGFFLSSW